MLINKNYNKNIKRRVNPFHLVELRPWPILGSGGAALLTAGLVIWFYTTLRGVITLGLILILITIYQWWRDVSRESTIVGFHTFIASKGLRMGIVLFILSEVCFFFAFFWAYFHSRLSPRFDLGEVWPPVGIISLSPWSIPVLNTLVLLASGVTVTWAHIEIVTGLRCTTFTALILTRLLGVYFTYLQGIEYSEVRFSLRDNVFGTTFFVATGFHGLHVLIGTIFLFITTFRHTLKHFSRLRHFGFEAAAWYWHFVDVVWLFLFVSIYWWGK